MRAALLLAVTGLVSLGCAHQPLSAAALDESRQIAFLAGFAPDRS